MRKAALASATILTLAIAGKVEAKSRWHSVCRDFDKRSSYAECFRPPGSSKYAYEMEGKAQEKAMAQGRKAVGQRKRWNKQKDRR